MEDTTGRALRRDAEVNRQRLLAAAEELFAEHGLDMTLNDVARRAGVGVATAYRRFANKEEVIDALVERHVDQVVARATDGLADPDAWRGLTTFLERSLDMQRRHLGLKDLLSSPGLGRRRGDEARDRIAPLINGMVERARRQGTLRPDVEGTDTVLIQVALTAIMNGTRTTSPDLYRRYLTIFFDGLRADRGPLTDLPVAALTVQETHRHMAPAAPGEPDPPESGRQR